MEKQGICSLIGSLQSTVKVLVNCNGSCSIVVIGTDCYMMPVIGSKATGGCKGKQNCPAIVQNSLQFLPRDGYAEVVL